MAKRTLWQTRAGGVPLVAALLAACGSPPTPTATAPSPSPAAVVATSPSPVALACPQSVLAQMTAAQRAGQLIFVGLTGNKLTAQDRTAIQEQHAGSVWFTELTGADSGSIQATAASVQSLVSPGATGGAGFLIGANQEGGTIDQFHGPGFTPIPSALDQGSLDPPTLQADAAGWAAELVRVGVNLNLAPVLDTVPPGTDASNQPIGVLRREFGHDPATVSAHGLAFMRGMQAGHVLVTVKHFPGLGRVQGNTDFSAQVVDTVTGWSDPYLGPFRDAIAAGADMVMVSTATYTRIDPDHQAAFSRTVMVTLLRQSLGFRGVIVADDLGATTSVAAIPVGTRAVDFVAAGGDLITVKGPEMVAAMVAALIARESGDPAFRARVDDAALRVLTLKARAGLLPCTTSR